MSSTRGGARMAGVRLAARGRVGWRVTIGTRTLYRSGSARLLAVAALALLPAAGISAHGRMRGEDAARIRAREAAELAALERSVGELVERARASSFAPGVSAAFALPDGRVGAVASGIADKETDAPMTPETRFLAGSVGKSLHAALAVALARDGVVDLDAPISRWIGREAWFARLPNGRDLTLRLLLQHRSGLIDHVWSLEFILKELRLRIFEPADTLLAPEQLIEIALDRDPRFAAGKQFAYGDTNYVLAGLVIERATKRSPFDQIEERFLRPLHLAGITPTRSSRIPGLAVGHQLPVNPFLLPPTMVNEGRVRVHPMLESTAGGFAATPRDLVRWAKALFEGRALPRGGVQEMTRNPVATHDGRHYGLGLFRYDTPLGSAWGHGGYFPGYRSGLLYFPDSKIAVAVQVNRDFAVDENALVLAIASRVQTEAKRYAANAH